MPGRPPPLLGAEEIERALRALPGWSRTGDSIGKTFRFRDFGEAFAFMTRVALAAERADHHPEWRNVYREVEIRLRTHASGGITQRDLALAAAIEGMLAPGG